MARPRIGSENATAITVRLDPETLAALDRMGDNRSESIRRLINDRGDVIPLPPRQIPGQESLLGVAGPDDSSVDRHPSAQPATATPSQRITVISGRCPVYKDGRHVVGLGGRCKGCGTAV